MNNENRVGSYIPCTVVGERYQTYLPKPLPPNPPLDMTQLYGLLEQANTAIGRLDGLSLTLPDPALFLYAYVRKEAVLSSQIEGTQSSLSDLFLFENSNSPNVPLDDVTEVSNYVLAMEYGLARIRNDDFPLSLRLLKEIHVKLLVKGGRGAHKMPGEFRRSQNWIGGTRPGNATFVPPPPEKVLDLLSDLEKFIHDDSQSLPTLIKAALVHVQFETIHPFLDGNGRLGRLLITFILCVHGLLKEPLLYLSLYFKSHRKQYYDLLQQVRETGEWEKWLRFFLEGVIATANQATQTAKEILRLFEHDKQKIEHLGRAASSTLYVYQCFQKKPILNAKSITQEVTLTLPTVNKALQHLTELGIIYEYSGRTRKRIFVYQKYLDLLNEGIDVFE
ncbi:MAG: Fic family protein [Legionellales bacterium]|nr:Fic family protein [Legionellales bacterium]